MGSQLFQPFRYARGINRHNRHRRWCESQSCFEKGRRSRCLGFKRDWAERCPNRSDERLSYRCWTITKPGSERRRQSGCLGVHQSESDKYSVSLKGRCGHLCKLRQRLSTNREPLSFHSQTSHQPSSINGQFSYSSHSRHRHSPAELSVAVQWRRYTCSYQLSNNLGRCGFSKSGQLSIGGWQFSRRGGV